ncbi:MAG TPA: nucleotidyltransferase domain-containing protein, partial [Patescibacteria group bacterium]|nr:nucleotidyltransferase domain-containing protein [Patescibacteria group bacterium]
MTQPVDIRPCDLKIVQDILHDVLPPDAQVWVFGSRAKWTTKDSSDLDLAIDAGRALTSKEASALADAFEESDLPYTVDVADMWSVSDTFREIIERDKVALQSSGKKGK